MPFALLIIGAVLLVSAVRNTQDDLFTLVKGDLTGEKNFVYWIVAILLIGAVGYIPKLKTFSNVFLVLVIVVLLLSNQGFFAKFTQQINQTQKSTPGSSSVPGLSNLLGAAQLLSSLFGL